MVRSYLLFFVWDLVGLCGTTKVKHVLADHNYWLLSSLYLDFISYSMETSPDQSIVEGKDSRLQGWVYTSACRNGFFSRKLRQGISARFSCRNFMPKCFEPKFCAESFGTVPKFWLRILAWNFGIIFCAETFGTFFPCQNSEP